MPECYSSWQECRKLFLTGTEKQAEERFESLAYQAILYQLISEQIVKGLNPLAATFKLPGKECYKPLNHRCCMIIQILYFQDLRHAEGGVLETIAINYFFPLCFYAVPLKRKIKLQTWMHNLQEKTQKKKNTQFTAYYSEQKRIRKIFSKLLVRSS